MREGTHQPEFRTTSTTTEVPTSSDIKQLSASPFARVRAVRSCRVPASWSYPYLIENKEALAQMAGGRADRVCLAEETQVVANEFCHWVGAFDERLRKIRSCYQAAARHARDLAREAAHRAGQPWRVVEAQLPRGWRTEVADELAGLSTWATLLMSGSQSDPVPATPFCVPSKRTVAPAEQVNNALDTLDWAWQMLAAEQQRVLSILKRGISLRSARDGSTVMLDYSVEIVEEQRPRPALDRACYFSAVAE